MLTKWKKILFMGGLKGKPTVTSVNRFRDNTSRRIPQRILIGFVAFSFVFFVAMHKYALTFSTSTTFTTSTISATSPTFGETGASTFGDLATFGIANPNTALVAENDSAMQNSSKLNEIIEKGDAKSQYELGVKYFEAYEDGSGTEEDYRIAAQLFHASATQGYADAQYRLALMFLENENTYDNFRSGMLLLTKAADKGHIPSIRYAIKRLSTNLDKTMTKREAIDYGYALSEAYAYLLFLMKFESDNEELKILEKKYLAKLSPNYIEDSQIESSRLWEAFQKNNS